MTDPLHAKRRDRPKSAKQHANTEGQTKDTNMKAPQFKFIQKAQVRTAKAWCRAVNAMEFAWQAFDESKPGLELGKLAKKELKRIDRALDKYASAKHLQDAYDNVSRIEDAVYELGRHCDFDRAFEKATYKLLEAADQLSLL